MLFETERRAEGRQWYVAIAFIVIVGILLLLYLKGLLVVDVPPAPPRDVVASQEGVMVYIMWNPSISGDVIGYNVYRSTFPGELGNRLTNEPVNSTVFVDASVINESVYYYTVRSVDKRHEDSNLNQVSVFYDRTPPEDCSINLSKYYVNKRKVRLNLVCKGAYQCRYKNNGENWSRFLPYTNLYIWNISGVEGVNRIYYQCRDRHGNLCVPVYADVFLDLTPPSIIVTPLKGFYFADEDIVLEFRVDEDTNEKVICIATADNFTKEIEITEEKIREGVYNNITLENLSLGEKIIRIECTDAAGNTNVREDVITIRERTVEEELEYFLIDNNATFTHSLDVNLYLNILNAFQCRFTNDNKTWSIWKGYKNVYNWELDEGEGVKTVCCECVDIMNNSLGTFCDSIEYVEKEEEGRSEPTGPPVISFMNINNDWNYTNDRMVRIYYYVSNAERCLFRNEDFRWKEYYPCPENGFQWILPDNGEREYIIEFAALNRFGVSRTVYDSIFYDITPPSSARSFYAIPFPNGEISLDWTGSESVDVYLYNIYRRHISSPTPMKTNGLFSAYKKIASVAETEYLDTNTVGGNEYEYYIRPVDYAGNEGDKTDVINVIADSVKPSVHITHPEDGDVFEERDVEVEFNVFDDLTTELYCYVYLNTALIQSLYVESGSVETVGIYLDDEHSQTIRINCGDNAGNIGEDSVNVYYERGPNGSGGGADSISPGPEPDV